MKNKLFNIFLILVTSFSLVACKPDEPEPSKATFYPIIELKGEKYISIVVGESFVDPGISATVNGVEIEYSTLGEVDVSKVGFYKINYSALNDEGFSASDDRYVMVLPESEKADAVNLEGKWETNNPPNNNARFADIVKLAPGFYFTSNCWGSGSAAIIPAYFYTVDGSSLIIPRQKSINLIETVSPGSCVDGKIDWTINRIDFNTALYPDGLIVNKFWVKL